MKIIITLLALISLSGAAHAEWDEIEKGAIRASMTLAELRGLCDTLDAMVLFQARTNMLGGSDFVMAFIDSLPTSDTESAFESCDYNAELYTQITAFYAAETKDD